jgi:hypothetical protein
MYEGPQRTQSKAPARGPAQPDAGRRLAQQTVSPVRTSVARRVGLARPLPRARPRVSTHKPLEVYSTVQVVPECSKVARSPGPLRAAAATNWSCSPEHPDRCGRVGPTRKTGERKRQARIGA